MRTAAALVVFSGVVLCGCRASAPVGGRYPRVDVDDPSVLLEEPFRTTTGAFNQNGTAFDRAEVELEDAVVVWLPNADGPDVEVLGGDAGRVVVELEKRWFDYSHRDGTDIRETRNQVQVRVFRPAGAVVVAVDRGWGHMEGGMRVIARIHVPPGVRVERGEPPAGDAGPLIWDLAPQTPVPVPESRR